MTISRTRAHGDAWPDPRGAACGRAMLVVAHPGHELRVYGWLSLVRPRVCVLTDGSGSDGVSRLSSTSRILAQTAARPGSIYGRCSDRAIYAAILAHDFGYFARLADELAALLVAGAIEYVVGDAVEGYNPTHDVCRLVVNAAVRVAAARGAAVTGYDFAVVGEPDQCPDGLRPRALWLDLDEETLARKLEAARSYPELARDVDHALARFGARPFRTECLRPVDAADRYGWNPADVPFYERYGEQRVAEGRYAQVLRFRDHVMPLADALWRHSEIRR